MNRILGLLAVSLLLGVPAFGQQDPNDPGIQDSVILGSASIDSGAANYVAIPIYIVTDDSVTFYNIPLSWESSLGGIYLTDEFFYYPPFNCRDDGYDTVFSDQQHYIFFEFGNLDTLNSCIYNTGGTRALFTNMRFFIAPNVPRQLAVIDTFWNDHSLSIMFGLIDGITGFTPAFQRGFIAIGPDMGVGDEEQTPQSFSLDQNYPNPFNPSTNIDFALAKGDRVILSIYDLLGQHLRTLLDDRLAAGKYCITWDGKDQSGRDLPSGIYLYRITSSTFSDSKKMILVR